MNWSTLLAFWACENNKVADTSVEVERDPFLYVEQTPTGDMSCFADGYQDAWITKTPLAENIGNSSVNSIVWDFENKDEGEYVEEGEEGEVVEEVVEVVEEVTE